MSYLYMAIMLCMVFQFYSCSNTEHQKNADVILAIVDSDTITVNDFRINYELGFANLKSGENKKKSYLDYMINEKLISLEGYRINLDKSEYVSNNVESLKRELLIESLIKYKVKDKIKVTEKEIKEAINKSKVRFKFRYWFESTYDKAKEVAAAMRVKGYADVVEEILLNNPENRINPKYLETDYLNNDQVSPEILIAIQDLPYGDISDPVEINDNYYIFQVMDIRRNAVTENEYMSKASSVEQVIFYKKFQNALVEYGTELLDKKSIKTKKKAFNLLADAILEWKKLENNNRLKFIEYLLNPLNELPALKKLSNNQDELFLEYNDGAITIIEFIRHINTSQFLKKFKSKNEFLNFMHNKVAQTIRDIFLVREAKFNNLEKNKTFQKDLSRWKNKWVYEAYRNQIVNKLSEDKDTKQEIKSTLVNKIDELRNNSNIEIYDSILDTIKVIDFKKSKWATMQIFKSGSNRPAYPVVDPRLGSLNN